MDFLIDYYYFMSFLGFQEPTQIVKKCVCMFCCVKTWHVSHSTLQLVLLRTPVHAPVSPFGSHAAKSIFKELFSCGLKSLTGILRKSPFVVGETSAARGTGRIRAQTLKTFYM